MEGVKCVCVDDPTAHHMTSGSNADQYANTQLSFPPIRATDRLSRTSVRLTDHASTRRSIHPCDRPTVRPSSRSTDRPTTRQSNRPSSTSARPFDRWTTDRQARLLSVRPSVPLPDHTNEPQIAPPSDRHVQQSDTTTSRLSD